VGWTFVQGEIKPGENFVDGAKRELMEEAGFKKEDLKYLPQNKDGFYPNPSSLEFHPISTKRFTLHGMEFNASEHYVLFFEYKGKDSPKLNWENANIAWIPKDEVERKLSIEKRIDWKI
jgi:8-oxo-dGTP pyrophosphatase MutT (NUDIX family)